MTYPEKKVSQHIESVIGMRNLGMKLDAVQLPGTVIDTCGRARCRISCGSESLWYRGNNISVAHPGDTFTRQIGEKLTTVIKPGHGFTVLPGGIGLGGNHCSAKLPGQ